MYMNVGVNGTEDVVFLDAGAMRPGAWGLGIDYQYKTTGFRELGVTFLRWFATVEVRAARGRKGRTLGFEACYMRPDASVSYLHMLLLLAWRWGRAFRWGTRKAEA